MESDIFSLEMQAMKAASSKVDTRTVMLFAVELSVGRSLMMSQCVPTVQLPGAATRGEEKRDAAYAGMELQPSAKDCIRLWHGGRRAGGKRREAKRSGIARRPSNMVSCEGRREESLFL